MRTIELDYLFTIRLQVPTVRSLGATPLGGRRIATIGGGSFDGPRLRGTVVPGGGDWILVRANGSLQLDVRVTLETDDGALIYLSYRGIRAGRPEVLQRLDRGEPVDPSEYYFRTSPVLETGAPAYAWLNNVIAVGTGERLPSEVVYTVYAVA